MCVSPQEAIQCESHTHTHTHTHTHSQRVCCLCVCVCVCVCWGEGWLLLKRGAPLWTFPRLKSSRQLRSPEPAHFTASPLPPPAAPTLPTKQCALIREEQREQLLSPPLHRGASQTRSRHFRMDSSPSRHLSHWAWRRCSLVELLGEGAGTDRPVRCFVFFFFSFFFSPRGFLFWSATVHSSPGSEMGMYMQLLLLQYYFVSSFVCNAVAFVEEPSGGRSDGYCGRILRAQTQGTRRDGHHEFRLRVEGDPESYQPGSTYRGRVHRLHQCVNLRQF